MAKVNLPGGDAPNRAERRALARELLHNIPKEHRAILARFVQLYNSLQSALGSPHRTSVRKNAAGFQTFYPRLQAEVGTYLDLFQLLSLEKREIFEDFDRLIAQIPKGTSDKNLFLRTFTKDRQGKLLQACINLWIYALLVERDNRLSEIPSLPKGIIPVYYAELIKQLAQATQSMRVLEIGAGLNDINFLIDERIPPKHHITLLDKSDKVKQVFEALPAALRQGLAVGRTPVPINSQVTFDCADFFAMAETSYSFDLLRAVLLLRYLEPPQLPAFFQKARRLMAASGRLLVVDSSFELKDKNLQREIKQAAINAGHVVVAESNFQFAGPTRHPHFTLEFALSS